MKFQLVVKSHGPRPQVLASLEKFEVTIPAALEIHSEFFTAKDAEQIIETEQFLERLFGFRVHINSVIE